MKFKNIGLKIFSVIFSLSVICQALCPHAFAGWTTLHERLEDGVNMTVDDIRAIVESDPSSVKQLYRDEKGKACSVTTLVTERTGSDLENGKEILKYLIENGAPTSSLYNKGYPIFCHDLSDYDFLKWLWKNRSEYNINFKETNRTGGTFLHILAYRFDKTDLLEEVCSSLPELTSVHDDYEKTFLHTAAELGHKNVVDFILKNRYRFGIDVNEPDKYGQTPLYLARRHDDVKTALIFAGAKEDDSPNKKVTASGYSTATATTTTTTATTTTTTATTATSTTAATATTVAEKKAPKTPMGKKDPKDKTEALSCMKNNINAESYAVFSWALYHYVRLCGVDYQDPDSGNTILHDAMEKCSSKRVETILKDYKAGPNLKNKDGDTPLTLLAKIVHDYPKFDKDHYYCRVNNIINLLAKYKADVNETNNHGDTPLLIITKAVLKHNNRYIFRIMDLLIDECDADPNIKNNDGESFYNFRDHPKVKIVIESSLKYPKSRRETIRKFFYVIRAVTML